MSQLLKKTMYFATLALIIITTTPSIFAHCEIPCGIYGDRMRIDVIAEDITTVEKSMQQIQQLTAAKPEDKDWNQLVRWINNKELHANRIQEVVYQYFMNQRITPVEEADTAEYKKYVKELTLLHKILVQAMKSKQTTDIQHVTHLRQLLQEFSASYFADKNHHH